jgi:hypothetical protein
MKRRDVLVGGAAVGLAPQAMARTSEPDFDPVVVEAALARIDMRMASLATMEVFPGIPKTSAESELLEARARVVRAASRTLYFTGAFMELEEHQRLHPGVQERMRRLQPEMDEAVDGMASYVESLSLAEHRALQDAFRRDPDLATRVGEQLHQVAKEDGFGFSRRVDLRLAVADFAARIRTQNASLVLDPIAEKVRRIQANPRTEAEQERLLTIRSGEQAFWDFQQRSARAVAAWDAVYANRPALYLGALDETYPTPAAPPPAKSAKERAGEVMRTGGVIMGIGVGTAALGGILYLASSSLHAVGIVLGVTVGPILLIAGIIVLIVGAVMSGNAK